ncbi:pentapeptide repeat-containing protein [Ktedonobacter racemifer]|uniref:Pentapeptide repeat protein n=1 Tax=Ktedonobacter racemifer DSM 44963 TaxID=485913 RepID=D6TQZ6_KTERA|nr:pentapeptide repeat-containing protein [Ktedonobacter racemifer]EFH85867.1 pentapeptide repeat protein [Ktedonobacter racemifer DSM 44963]
MYWLKKGLWPIGIIITSTMLFLLILITVLSVPTVYAKQTLSKNAIAGTATVQTTPTEDLTVTTLNKELLTQELNDQQHTRDNWLWSNVATILSSALSTLVIVIGVLFGFWQWSVGRKDTQNKASEDRRIEQDKELKDRQAEREKRAEERFQSAVTGLGDEKEGTRIGSAILLRTFLRPGYEQFYTQTFDLAVAHLCLPRASSPSENQTAPLTTLSQTLIVIFREAFPLARSQNDESPQMLDATRIQLDNAYLALADVRNIWMPYASLQQADLKGADLRGANLNEADLKSANLEGANLAGANLKGADLGGVNLKSANLNEADLKSANLEGANLAGANLKGADLGGVNLKSANLNEADLKSANLEGANLAGANLNGTKLEGVNLKGANLNRASFVKANLEDADLKDVNLNDANLNGANLMKANLENAQLEGAKLKGVKLNGITLFRANLERATLYGADLSNARLNGANLKRSNLERAVLENTDLSGANLSQANLKRAKFERTNLFKANLSQTNLIGARGLTEDQLLIYKTMGAITDGLIIDASQSDISSPSSAQRDPVETSSTTLPQGRTLPSHKTGNETTKDKD